MPPLDQFIVWIVVGLLGGSLAGLLITWERKGLGLLRNLGVGLAGALIGGLLFRLFGLFPDLDKIAISLRDVVRCRIVDRSRSFLVLAAVQDSHSAISMMTVGGRREKGTRGLQPRVPFSRD
jgi:uncharacterized membrane protein YeaQ/YmgE (transglycosylase-associated protein family)